MSALRLSTQLSRIGEAFPISFPSSFQTAPKSLRDALRSMNSPNMENWRFLFKKKYLNTGWSHEFQGLAHDHQDWYFFNKGAVMKFDRNYQKIAEQGIPLPLQQQGYDHIGDGDYHDGLLYAPLEHNNYIDPVILVFDASLNVVRSGKLTTTRQQHAPWCAVHPWNGLVYTSEGDSVSTLYAYDAHTFSFIGHFRLYDANGQAETLNSIQGGCFSQNGRLYLASGNTDDIRCYSMLNGRLMGSMPVSYSKGFPEYEEMEGIAIWDLSGSGQGHLHVAILDNDWPSQDDLYLYHYGVANPEML